MGRKRWCRLSLVLRSSWGKNQKVGRGQKWHFQGRRDSSTDKSNWLLLQGTQIQFLEPTWLIITFSNSKPKESNALFWLSWVLHTHGIQVNKRNLISNLLFLCPCNPSKLKFLGWRCVSIVECLSSVHTGTWRTMPGWTPQLLLCLGHDKTPLCQGGRWSVNGVGLEQHQVPQNWSYRQFWTAWFKCCESNPGPLQKQHKLITTRPSQGPCLGTLINMIYNVFSSFLIDQQSVFLTWLCRPWIFA